MFIRFVTHSRDCTTGNRLGVFHSAYELRSSGKLAHYEEEKVTETLEWFKKNLKIPNSFTTSSKPNAEPKAISWYKHSAKECITRMYDLKAILEEHGIIVELIQTDNPGYVVYEDENQITAEPFKSTNT